MMAIDAISIVLSTAISNLIALSSAENNFVTGNVSALRLRRFNYPLQSIPQQKNVSFGILDTEFSNINYLNSGTNSVVYTGIRGNKDIAIKMLKPTSKYIRIAVDEMHMEMQILSRLEHPNIITVYGAGETPRKFIMLEYLGGRTLDNLLQHTLFVHKKYGIKSESVDLPWETVHSIAMELASALKYLHEDFHPLAMVIHRDLKPQNIGFTTDKKLKLFDFGLAVCVRKNRTSGTTYKMTGNTGTLAYMAPEVALRKPYNEKVDVYSFAILLWQMLSGMEVNGELALGGDRRPPLPAIAARAPIGVTDLIERCWHADHTKRPDFTAILRYLTDCTAEESCSASVATEEIATVGRCPNTLSSIKNSFLPSAAVIPVTTIDKDGSCDLDKCKCNSIKVKPSSTTHSIGSLLLMSVEK